MADTERAGFWRVNNPIMWACLVTAGFIGLIIWFGVAETCNTDLFPEGDCPPKWRHLQVAPPNEVGDTLAGLAGVLAFIWLIATVLLQSVELGEQRRVLALQREEMEGQRKATQDMARSMSVQAKIFGDEKKRRNEEKSSEVLTKASTELARCFFEADLDSLVWWTRIDTTDAKQERYLMHGYVRDSTTGAGIRVLELIRELFGSAVRRIERDGPNNLQDKPRLPDQLVQLSKYLNLIVECEKDLPTVDAEKLREFGIREAEGYLNSLLTGPLWDNPRDAPR